MTACRYCGQAGAYDSGFSVECTNRSCHCFSQKQADLMGLSPPMRTDSSTSFPVGTEIEIRSRRGEWKVSCGGKEVFVSPLASLSFSVEYACTMYISPTRKSSGGTSYLEIVGQGTTVTFSGKKDLTVEFY